MQAKRYQIELYPKFVEKVLDEGASIFHTSLTFSELAHIIERTEHKIYSFNNQITMKQFRNNETCRASVLKKITLAWKTIQQLSTHLDITLNQSFTNRSIEKMQQSPLDSYDAFYIQCMTDNGINNIITDDGDFVSANMSIFTANRKMLNTNN